jgi:hypothetical protein
MAIGAALIVAGVLLATTPWSGEEAAGGTIQYRVCDFVIEAPTPQGKGDIRVNPLIEPHVEPSLEVEVLGEPDAVVVIDPTSDVIESQTVPDARLQPVLDTLRIEPLDPSTAPWPYTDSVQRPPIHQDKGIFGYQLPDPKSGLVVTTTHVSMTDGSIVYILGLANCRSTMEREVVFRKGEESEVMDLTRDVHPDDEVAFRTFFDEVTVKALPY